MSKKQFFAYNPMIGTTIDHAIAAMIELAIEHDMDVKAEFNGITIIASRYNTPESVKRFYQAEMDRQSEAYNNSPAKAESDRRVVEYREKFDAAMIEGILPFSMGNQDVWDKIVADNDTDLGRGIVYFAARWANLMEAKMAEGAKLEDIADEAGREADVYGMSGYTYGLAVAVLSEVWEHGDQFRRWHNLSTQIGNEGELANENGGVLNPALIGISFATPAQ